MIAVDISPTMCCGECGHIMLCHTVATKGVHNVQLECRTTDCKEHGERYWLPLRTVEIEPVSDAAVRHE